MSSPASAGPNEGFHQRLNRVAEARAPIDAAKPEVNVLPDWKENVAGKSGMFVAFLIGIVSVLAVRIASFHYVGVAMVSDTPDFTLAIETVAAFFLSIILFRLTKNRGAKFYFAQFAGVVLMISAMHNAVHAAPRVFSTAFSTEWVSLVTQKTDPNSLYLRGQSIPFVPSEKSAEEDAPAEKVLPKVRRMG